MVDLLTNEVAVVFCSKLNYRVDIQEAVVVPYRVIENGSGFSVYCETDDRILDGDNLTQYEQEVFDEVFVCRNCGSSECYYGSVCGMDN